MDQRVQDFSEWFLAVGRIPPYYLHYLALGITNGIIFENFLAQDPEEQRFLSQRVFPSFAQAMQIFGVRPLVVRLFDAEEESDSHMWQYPGELYSFAKTLLWNGKDSSVANLAEIC